MHHRCKRCGPTGEWHFEHADEPGIMEPTPTRDDLIRLVVGMQRREAIALHHHGLGIFEQSGWADRLSKQTASTIVDEWLGVR